MKIQKLCSAALMSVLFLLAVSCDEPFAEETITCTYEPAPEVATHPKAQQYTQLLNDYVKKGLPGISLLVEDVNGTWVGSAGKADISKDIDMLPCHLSKAASITKMFVAVCTMQLVEEGKLDLDEKITRWLPGSVTDNIENANQVTLRQLLNHRTGIYDIIDDDRFYLEIVNNPTKRRSLEELAEFVYDKPAVFPAGDSAAYSNTNTLLVSMIIESVTSKSYEQVVKERLIEPLGLDNTQFISDGLLSSATAQGYYDLYNNGTIVNLTNYNTASGYGGMYSNVFDLQKFMEAFLVDKSLVSEASLNQMLTFSSNVENGKLIGLGTMKDFLYLGDGNHAYGHRGRDLGYTADLFYFPNHQATMALFINYGTDADSDLKPVFNEFREKLGVLIIAE